VGRMSREDGGARLRPFSRPPTTRINGSRHARPGAEYPRN
jgi:hypothetical protein